MNRREFLQKALLSAGLLSVSDVFAEGMVARKEAIKISILHTNDVHSHIEPFPDNHKRYAGKGGVQNRFNLIQELRKENRNTLLFDCGDIFQGTPYFNKYGGELELKLMSQMGYDASTLGNHDFDNGMEGFLAVKNHANFPFICSNYDFEDTILKNKTLPFKIFNKGGIKVGVFGLGIKLDGLVDKKLYGNTKYQDPIKIANEYSELLRKNHKCELVICLSHLGYSYSETKVSDSVLATKTSGIDLILGGHTHTFLEKAKEFTNFEGEKVLVNQVGWAGLNLGKIDFYFTKSKKKRLNIQSGRASFLEIK
ncbi:metallophosphatase [Flavobacteriales bacterium]|nr:metallophosphatase [Flavobacteriales bacterium]